MIECLRHYTAIEDEGLSVEEKKKPAVGQEFVHCKLSGEFFFEARICKCSFLGKMSQFHFRKKKNKKKQTKKNVFLNLDLFVSEAGFELELSRFP